MGLQGKPTIDPENNELAQLHYTSYENEDLWENFVLAASCVLLA